MRTVRRLGMTAVLSALFLTGIGIETHASNWWETVKVKGDLRYRHEMLDEGDKGARHRQRIRARLGISGTVSDYTKVTVQLATGSSDPVSTNQTLDNSFSTKNIGVDLAYFEAWHKAVPGVKLTAGKFKNPFFKPGKSELLWDSDLNPEGGTVRWTGKGEKVNVTLIGAGLWIDERSSGDDSWMGALQGLASFDVGESGAEVAIGGGYFDYVNIEGFPTFADEEDSFGNTVVEATDGEDTWNVYSTDYELLELFGELKTKINEHPLTVLFDFVTNTAADSLNTGWLVGMRLGKTSESGSWAFRYNYRNVEADAVVGAFTDSDFRGGGTDAKGHELGGAVQLAANTTFGISYFINETGLEATEATDFNRLQIDLQLKF